MKKYLYIAIALLMTPFLVNGQTDTLNYTQNTVYQNPYSITDVEAGNVTTVDKLETITYYDGLGRPMQTVGLRAGANGEDLVTPSIYDALGRTPKQYMPLPVAGNGANYYDGAIEGDLKTYYKAKFPNDFYQGVGLYPDGWDNPYSETNYEESPLNRVLEQGAPGMDWRVETGSDTDHTIKFDYNTNTTGDNVKHFSVAFGIDYTDPSLTYEGVYVADELYKNTSKDENWTTADGNNHTVQEFTNKRGQLILKRQFNNGAHDTYFVYDDDGNLTYVLSPEGADKILDGSNNIDPNVLSELCYTYKYDHRGRIFEKKIPSKGIESIIYDVLDRPVLTQDEEMRLDGDKWMFTKYDTFDRVVYTGIVSGYTKAQAKTALGAAQQVSETRSQMPITVGGTSIYYTNGAFPALSNLEIHTITYYDSYTNVGGVPNTNAYGVSLTTAVKGLPTVSKVRVLDDVTNTQHWITTTTGFDIKARPVYVDVQNPYLGVTDQVESLLDFTGKPTETKSVHNKTGINPNTVTTYDYFGYDHVGRLLAHAQKVNDEPVELIARNHYDELGQLVKKDVGGETFVDGYTGIVDVEVAVDGTMTKTGSSNAWDAGVKTRGEVVNDGGVRFTINQTNKRLRVGLEKPASGIGSNGWEDFDYAITTYGNGKVHLVIDGVEGNEVASYNTNDSFSVERIGTSIYFKKNGSNLISPVTDTSGIAMTGKASFYTSSGALEAFELFGTNIDKVLQEVDYKYNVRGWMTHINDPGYSGLALDNDLFKFKINYNEAIEGTASNGGLVKPLYNGNISQTIWKSANDNGTKHTYGYQFDPLNRIKAAYSRKGANLDQTDDYSVYGIGYDKNGNINNLIRNGSNVDGSVDGVWDDLDYVYSANSNQLLSVTDNSTSSLNLEGFMDGNTVGNDYNYDENGNMIFDKNKGITSIDYNHLNLAENVSVSNTEHTGTITYIYDAIGIKLKKTMTDNGVSTTTKYAGNFVYDGDDLQFFFHPEGYVNFVEGTTSSVRGSIGGQTTQSSYNYVFQYTDHLGNVRLSYEDKDKNGSVNASEIIEESHYYPFGLKQKGYNNIINGGNGLAQSWKYNGIEYEEALGLDLYEMDVRQYDPAIARWTSIDPVTHHSMSTYNAFDNNPVFWADPSGADGMSGIGGFSCHDCGSGTVRGSDMAEGATKGNDGFIGGTGETGSERDTRRGIGVKKSISSIVTGKPISLSPNAGNSGLEASASGILNGNNPPDYFDKDTGEYLGEGGTDKIRFISKEDWKKGNLENFSTSTSDANVEASVYRFYAENNNLIPEDAKDCMFCGGRPDGWSTSNYDGVLAFNFSNHTIGLDILNRFDAINVITHELGGHGNDFLKGLEYKRSEFWNWESRATNLQVRHWSWSKTSESFKKLIFRAYGKHVLSAKDQLKYFGKYGINK